MNTFTSWIYLPNYLLKIAAESDGETEKEERRYDKTLQYLMHGYLKPSALSP